MTGIKSIRTCMAAKRAASLAIFVGCSVALTSCASTPDTKVVQVSRAKSKEYFSEAAYGVKASPRVISTIGGKRLPRGGGREQVGKPYKVKGRWYVPKLDPNYQAMGTASWYGDAFHGRLTANGEIYDMNHLSAAHPTMPLPSYARVTNTKNGNSVIVRVNDRGPYANNRLIDLSKRAAQLLDYTSSGTAQVKVEYVGPAPVDGQDDQYLLASYQPGTGGMPSNPGEQPVMVASAQMPVDDASLPGVNAFANEIPAAATAPVVAAVSPVVIVKQPRVALAKASALAPMDPVEMPEVPAFAPTPSDRPETCVAMAPCDGNALRGALSGYADERVRSGHAADAFRSMDLDAAKIVDWKQAQGIERILVGTFPRADLQKAKTALAKLARVSVEINEDGTVELYAIAANRLGTDKLLKKLWDQGYADAFVVR